MKPASKSPSNFYFELSANDERTPFLEVEGISTEVALKHILKEGENPFKYRVPSFPKTGNLVLKNGVAKKDSKLMQWCAANMNEGADQPTNRSRAVLHLKDAKGNSLLEWTLFNAYPVSNHVSSERSKSSDTGIDDLELAFSFYTLSRK